MADFRFGTLPPTQRETRPMDAQEPLRQRLNSLREEYAAGLSMIRDVEQRQEELRTMMLRISGAIQVLEELLAGEEQPSSPAPLSLSKSS
jgi:hypothetical protein